MIIFAILGPIVMIGTALILTLCEGDFWLPLFLVYLAGILMLSGTIYLAVLTLLWEWIRHIHNKARKDMCKTPFMRWMHRLFIGTSIAGIITLIPFFLIFYDILNGSFAILHFLCSGTLVVLYLIFSIYTIAHRSKTNSSK